MGGFLMAVFQSDDEINDGTQMWVNSLVMDGVGEGGGTLEDKQKKNDTSGRATA